jgi:hypothetical protein
LGNTVTGYKDDDGRIKGRWSLTIAAGEYSKILDLIN